MGPSVVATLAALQAAGEEPGTGFGLAALGVGFVFTGIGATSLGNAVLDYRKKRRTVDVPTTKIRSAAVGLVEVKGRAVPIDGTITSPFRERECLLCQYAVRPPRPRNSENQDPRPLDYGLAGVPFYVEDDTGRILVEPRGADVRLPETLLELDMELRNARELEPSDPGDEGGLAWGSADGSSEAIRRFDGMRRQFRERHGLPDPLEASGAVFDKLSGSGPHQDLPEEGTLHWVEACLAPGDEVYVLGHARPSADEAGSGGPRLVIRRNDPDPSPAGEWMADRLGIDDFVDPSADRDAAFVIATQSEEELGQARSSEMWKKLAGGLFTLLIGLAGIFVGYGVLSST